MPFTIIRNDITTMRVDAIVNAADSSLQGSGGVDGAVHRAAGPELLEACRALGGCPVGEARLTLAYRLPSRWVIHTAGPKWLDGQHGEPDQLAACYRSSLALAEAQGCESVAFPLISAGTFGFPPETALQIALDSIQNFLEHCDMTVYLVVFDRSVYQISVQRFSDIAAYIDDHYVGVHLSRNADPRLRSAPTEAQPSLPSDVPSDSWQDLLSIFSKRPDPPCAQSISDLSELLDCLDESFSQMLLRKIDERGMTDAQCYKRANIDRKLFSKIRSLPHYKPSKPTALAFAVSLELSLEETQELLKKAGFALSHSSKFDVIVEYFIIRGCYDIFEINEALFAFDQHLLGG